MSLLFHDDIDPALLQQAVNAAIGRFPLLSAKIRKGVFWNYFEQSGDPLLVERETTYPCYPMKNLWAGHLARVLYFGKKLSVEVFHALTDGAGAVEFLKAVAYQYLLLKGHEIDPEGKIMLPNEGNTKYETEDSFKSYYAPRRFQKQKQPRPYRIKGATVEPYGNIVISGEIATEEIKAASKAMGLTITQYLTAVLVFAIFQENLRYGLYHETITVAVPVNLRSFFPSRSLRNFFGVANICVPVSPETTFEGVAQAVKDEFSKKVTRSYLE